MREPATREFADWLADRAAYFTAEAGNLMVEGEESDQADAKESAQKARYYLKAWEIMVEVMNPDYSFEVAELSPKPLTT